MTTLFVRHQVNDYGKWREVYDGLAQTQKQAGVVAKSVYRAEGDANDLTVTHDFGSLSEAKAFAESAELRQAMAEAGVVGAPTVWFASKA